MDSNVGIMVDKVQEGKKIFFILSSVKNMQKLKIDQVTHLKRIFGGLGILLHIPAGMALLSLCISLIYEEYFSLIPFLTTMCISLVLGQVLYRLFYQPKECHLWDAMIIAALSWILVPLVGAIPYYWIVAAAAKTGSFHSSISEMETFSNTLFESFSAFTSTGLSVLSNPSLYPKTFQWWRTFSCWVGGTGLIVFVLSITQPGCGQYRLYYSEARNETVGTSVSHTSRIIAIIYTVYTVLGIAAYAIAGMPLWEAINHSMTSVSTGGFTITPQSFSEYNNSIKIISILLMLIGATSFALHYKIIRERKLTLLITNRQQGVYLIVLAIGALLSLFVQQFDETPFPLIDLLFNFVSASTTCGFSTYPIVSYLPNLKLVLILSMLIGGAAGSTAGGIKIQRFHDLLEGVYVRMRSMTEERERFIKAVSSRHPTKAERFGLPMGPRAERLYAAGILLTMWMVCLFIGWFLMLFVVSKEQALDAFFEIFSAVSNAGLSTGIMGPHFSDFGKFVYIFLMWVGRLEILPVLILVWAILLPFRRDAERETNGHTT